MKKKLFILCLIFASFVGYAQKIDIPNSKNMNVDPKTNKYRPELLLGGNFGFELGLGCKAFKIVVPEVGVYFVDWLLIGVGGNYSRVINDYDNGNVWGFSAFIQPKIKGFLFHGEYNFNNERLNKYGGDDEIHQEISNYHTVNAGIGYRYEISRRISIYSLMLIKVWDSSATEIEFGGSFKIGANFHL